MKLIITIIITLLLSLYANSQDIFKLTDPATSKSTSVNAVSSSSGKYIITNANLLEAVSNKLPAKLYEVHINYELFTGFKNASINIQRSEDNTNWVPMPGIDLPKFISTGDTTVSDKIELKKDSYLKFSIVTNKRDTIILKDITVHEDDATVLDILLTDNLDDVKESKEKLKSSYDKLLDRVEILYTANSDLKFITKLSQFLIKRTSMVNPLNYSQFTVLLDSLQKDASTLDSILVSQIKSSAKKSTEEYASKIMKPTPFLSTIFSIGSVLTGGRLATVFSIIKGIFTKTYSKTNMLMKRIEDNANTVFDITTVKNNPATIQIKPTVIEELSIKSKIKMEKLEELDNLMTVFDGETNKIDLLFSTFKDAGTNFNSFNENLYNYLKDDLYGDIEEKDKGAMKTYYDTIRSSATSYKKYFQSLNSKKFEVLENILKNKQSDKKKLNDAKSEIADLYEILKRSEDLVKDYMNNVQQFYTGMLQIQEGLNMENPFSNYPKLKSYFDEWKSKNDDVSDTFNDIPKDIKEKYISRVKDDLKKFKLKS